MCKTPIDANSNPGLYCFKEGCDTLFCKNCESFFRSSRGPGEKPYCSQHIAEFVGAPVPETSPGLNATQPVVRQPQQAPQVTSQPTEIVVGYTNPVATQQHQTVQQLGGVAQHVTQQMNATMNNPYLNLQMVEPITAFRRTIKSWNGEGRCQRSEYWWGLLVYYFPLSLAMLYSFGGIWIFNPSLFIYWIHFSWRFVIFWVLWIPVVSQQIRRLHDIGYSGRWVLVGIFVPYLGPLVLLILSVLPSQPHPNKYDEASQT